ALLLYLYSFPTRRSSDLTVILDQFPGTAPGLYLYHNHKHYFLLPGVPYEMKAIFEGSVIPKLREIAPIDEQIYTETVKVWGIPRSEEHTSELQSRFDLVC